MSLSLGAKIALGLVAAGLGYELVLKPKRKPKTKKPGISTIPSAPAPGGMRPIPAQPVDWERHFEQNVERYILEAQDSPNVRSLLQAQQYVATALFPTATWPPPTLPPPPIGRERATPWQEVVWNGIAALVRDKAKSALGWKTDLDAGATFWLAADKSIAYCIDSVGLTDFEQIKICAAQGMFPKSTWPPTAMISWQNEVWGAMDNKVMLALEARRG